MQPVSTFNGKAITQIKAQLEEVHEKSLCCVREVYYMYTLMWKEIYI